MTAGEPSIILLRCFGLPAVFFSLCARAIETEHHIIFLGGVCSFFEFFRLDLGVSAALHRFTRYFLLCESILSFDDYLEPSMFSPNHYSRACATCYRKSIRSIPIRLFFFLIISLLLIFFLSPVFSGERTHRQVHQRPSGGLGIHKTDRRASLCTCP